MDIRNILRKLWFLGKLTTIDEVKKKYNELKKKESHNNGTNIHHFQHEQDSNIEHAPDGKQIFE